MDLFTFNLSQESKKINSPLILPFCGELLQAMNLAKFAKSLIQVLLVLTSQ